MNYILKKALEMAAVLEKVSDFFPVSYTHLTLPTKA